MIRNRLNNIIEKKGFLIAFSVVASIILWMYVTYIDNPQETIVINGINIELEGEETLNEQGLLITDVDRETLSVEFSGRRSSIWRLNNTNVTATVDLEEIVAAGARTGIYQLSYEINYPDDVSPSTVRAQDRETNYVTVTVESLITVEIPIRGDNNVNVAEGYQAEPMEFSPSTIEVSGTEEAVSAVSYARVAVDADNLEETYTAEASFTLVDENGVAVDDANITTNVDTVRVTIPIIMVKTVDLRVNFAYTNAITEDNFSDYVTVTMDHSSITLSGVADVLENMDEIIVATIDLSDFAVSNRQTFTIPIPNDMTNVTGISSVAVEVDIHNLETQGYSASNITVENETAGYTTRIDTQSLAVSLRGTAEDLEDVTPENIRVVADMSELGEATGTYSVPATIYVDGFRYVDAIGDYYVTVTVTRR